MNGHGISRTVAPAASPAAPRTRRLRYLIIMLALVLATLWAAWHPLLVAMGELIVAEATSRKSVASAELLLLFPMITSSAAAGTCSLP